MTIADAIRQAMTKAGKPISANEAYDLIKTDNLYEFKAKNPQSIVSSTIRKHLKGVERKNSSGKKMFEEVDKGVYQLIQ